MIPATACSSPPTERSQDGATTGDLLLERPTGHLKLETKPTVTILKRKREENTSHPKGLHPLHPPRPAPGMLERGQDHRLLSPPWPAPKAEHLAVGFAPFALRARVCVRFMVIPRRSGQRIHAMQRRGRVESSLSCWGAWMLARGPGGGLYSFRLDNAVFRVTD